MSPEIRELDADTRDRIAAGEVIERPASVVKELLENALDADADRIEIAVEAGGADRITVSDNGVGMSKVDAELAIEEHTTSKLERVEELDAIGTLGFRGEALHAIGSVSRLRIETKPRGGSRGTALVVEGGELESCGPTGCPEGTTVEVTDLFGNVPARRKYLKTEATEFDHIARIATGYALSRPDVAISLSHDGRETFATPGDGDRQSAVLAVYGREVAEAMLPVDDDGEDEAPIDAVEGLVSHPETNRSGREYVTTLVNGRYVNAGAVREAIVDAYGHQLAPDRYPFAVIDLRLPPGGVDVNVHPRKLEVLFAREDEIKATVAEAVESALSAAELRSRAARGRSAPEQTEVSPGTPEPTDGSPDDAVSPASHRETGKGPDELPSTAESNTDTGSSEPGPETSTNSSVSGEIAHAGSVETTRTPDTTRDESAGESVDDERSRGQLRSTTQRTLDGAETAGTPESFDRLPSLVVLGQFDDTYLIAEADDGLVLIDQHAADERVNYERLREAFDGGVTTQTLAEPVTVGATARELALVSEYGDALSRLGFHVRTTGEASISVTTVPALLAEHAGADAPEIARDLLAEFVDGDPDGTIEALADDILGDLACHPSIKGNTSLREGTVAGLLSALDGCQTPYACPHGRPTLIELSTEEIEERFERDYPGHGGRRRE
jgi:DNA mismatch repair protein MutL